jgi:hypothetical protein
MPAPRLLIPTRCCRGGGNSSAQDADNRGVALTTDYSPLASVIPALAAANLGWLYQALTLVARLDDAAYAESPAGLAPHKAGAHLRHIIDFYDEFFQGLPQGRIDYSGRRRDARTERDRHFAIARLEHLAKLFVTQSLVDDPLLVRVEDAELGWMNSSVARELQVLSSHTIHHFALIALTLQAHGVAMEPSFGMAPSTLRYAESGRA